MSVVIAMGRFGVVIVAVLVVMAMRVFGIVVVPITLFM
jgi:hypothetical protein